MGCRFSDFYHDVGAYPEVNWGFIARGPLLEFWGTKKRFHYNNHYLHRFHDAGSRRTIMAEQV